MIWKRVSRSVEEFAVSVFRVEDSSFTRWRKQIPPKFGSIIPHG
jgi:hypothetical protein